MHSAYAIRPYGFMLFPHPLFLPKKGLPDMNRVRFATSEGLPDVNRVRFATSEGLADMNRVRFATSEGLAGVNRVIEPLQGSLASHT